MWSIDTWEKRKSVTLQLPAGKAPVGDTRVQFHSDQIRLLVVHETQLAIYDASKMDRIRQVEDLLRLLGVNLLLVMTSFSFSSRYSGFHRMSFLRPYHTQHTPATVN